MIQETVCRGRIRSPKGISHQVSMSRSLLLPYNRLNMAIERRITFECFVTQHWWKDYVMDGNHTPNSVAYYENMKVNLLRYFGSELALRDIDAETVKRYIGYLRKDARTKKGKPYSQSTIQHYYKCLVTILEYARRIHYIFSNPCDDLSPSEKPHVDIGAVDFLTALQAREFLRCLEAEPLYWRCFMNILITSGLRRGEAVGLQWRDIDSGKMTLAVERNVTLDKNSANKIHIGNTKGKRARKVPLSTRVHKMLMELYEERKNEMKTVNPEDFIFNRASAPALPLYPTEPTRWQRKFVERHGIRPVSPHDLRHTAATLALEGGANIKAVSMLLGHADPATTLRFYTGVSEDVLHQTVNDIECLLQYRSFDELRAGAVLNTANDNIITDVAALTNQILQVLSKAQMTSALPNDNADA